MSNYTVEQIDKVVDTLKNSIMFMTFRVEELAKLGFMFEKTYCGKHVNKWVIVKLGATRNHCMYDSSEGVVVDYRFPVTDTARFIDRVLDICVDELKFPPTIAAGLQQVNKQPLLDQITDIIKTRVIGMKVRSNIVVDADKVVAAEIIETILLWIISEKTKLAYPIELGLGPDTVDEPVEEIKADVNEEVKGEVREDLIEYDYKIDTVRPVVPVEPVIEPMPVSVPVTTTEPIPVEKPDILDKHLYLLVSIALVLVIYILFLIFKSALT